MTAGDVELRAQALLDAAILAAGHCHTHDVVGGLALVDRALRLLSPLRRPERRAVALDALVARGRMLAALHADDAALAVQSELVERFSDSDAPGAHRCVVSALARGARLLACSGRDDVGIVWAMRAIRAVDVSDDWQLRSRAEWSVDVLRELLARATGFEGVALERAVIARLARGRNAGTSFERARLLTGHAGDLAEDGDLLGALLALDDAERCLEDATAPLFRRLRLDVLLARARITQEAGFHRAAIALLDDEVDVCCDDDESLTGRRADLHVLRGSLLTALGLDEEAILAFAQALDVAPPEERPWEGHSARQRARCAWGVLQVVERLDLEAALVCYQAGLVGPGHLAQAARCALAVGMGGPAARTAAALDELSGDAAVEGARVVAAGIRAEHGLDEVVDAESSERVRLRLCAAIVAGGDAIALGWVVAATELLPGAEGLSSGFIRALTRSYPGIVTDDEVAAELVSRARRTLQRAGAEVAAQEGSDGAA